MQTIDVAATLDEAQWSRYQYLIRLTDDFGQPLFGRKR